MVSGKQRPPGVATTLKASDDSVDALRHKIKEPHRLVLVVLSGDQVGVRVVLDHTLLVGRDPEADLVLTDALVSWHHARIEDRGDSWTLIDLDSTNGTRVNDEVRQEHPLSPNDRIIFGSTVARLELPDQVEQVYNEFVERLLNIDDLSGLLVRRRFDADLGRLLEAARQGDRPLGLLVMDLDGIKPINDTYGHLFGAYVIGEAGRVIGRTLGHRGIAARFGGDEYIVGVPDLDASGATQVAEELRQAVAEHHYEREGVILEPTISIGVAAFPADAQDPATLFQRADEALYRAKQAGGNATRR